MTDPNDMQIGNVVANPIELHFDQFGVVGCPKTNKVGLLFISNSERFILPMSPEDAKTLADSILEGIATVRKGHH